jgi:hypothetical protein
VTSAEAGARALAAPDACGQSSSSSRPLDADRSSSRYPDVPRVVAFFDDLLQRIERLPGVDGTASTNSLPPDGLSETDNFIVEEKLPSVNRGAPVGPILSVSTKLPSASRAVVEGPLVQRWRHDIVHAGGDHQ